MFVSIGQAASMIGISISTLRRWEDEGSYQPEFRTIGGHRRYSVAKLQENFLGIKSASPTRKTFAYARVSSRDQLADLNRQKERLEDFAKTLGSAFEIIEDLGSGVNYKKRGLNKLIEKICLGEVGTLVLTHKDRLLRFGSPLLFKLCELNNTKVIILERDGKKDFESELVCDVLEIMTVFSSRIYGRRSHKFRKKKVA